MSAEPLTTYESWNLTQPAIPPRSRLYHLEPIGIGTPYVESLTSYISRLADAHSVPINLLMVEEIAPIIKGRGLTPPVLQKYVKDTIQYSIWLNGPTTSASIWVQALESTTQRSNLKPLTMLTWSEVLPQRGLLRNYRAWCPVCFQEWQMTKHPIYDPLLWTLQVVKACPYHRQYLHFKCPHCNQDDIPTLAWRSRPGYCPKCKQWLGIPLNSAIGDETLEGELEWEIWVAETIGDLLAAAPSLSSTPEKENITRALLTCADKVTDGNRAALARVLGVAKSTMCLWCNGKTLPQIDVCLQICYRLGWKLSTLLAGTSLISEVAEIKHCSPPTMKKPKSSSRPFPKKQILHSLNMALASNENPPPSMEEVARRLGYDPRFVRGHFPDLCRRISARYIEYKNEQSRLRTELLCKEIRQVTFELHAQGVNPTRRNVGLRLSKPGSFLEKAAQTAHKNALRELGLAK